ncbi:MAG: hypothetical protein CMM73_00885 [Rhodospirillaceae bacterium]|nr:hypothetical protein [Rhodospirillaceae bacterium]|tara:strand:- start:76 stop:261 length:186 start_codon:yes stop_codon:yes gene_type:complete
MAARIPSASAQMKSDGADEMTSIGVGHQVSENAILMAGFDSYNTDRETILLAYMGVRFNFD